ncbi:unnamed protein product [Brugia timori]|uniref:G_PROTEIN_RECEP_F1_2 domain-containing protein n=1 Tax=Brugia timori TaxID=42155 RepID=A0A0R3Q891_9BILA|nr:unnamed protein product [Brugia timori]
MITIVGNSLVVISVFSYRPLKKVQNYFLVSLAASDLCVATFVMPLHVVKFIAVSKYVIKKAEKVSDIITRSDYEQKFKLFEKIKIKNNANYDDFFYLSIDEEVDKRQGSKNKYGISIISFIKYTCNTTQSFLNEAPLL